MKFKTFSAFIVIATLVLGFALGHSLRVRQSFQDLSVEHGVDFNGLINNISNEISAIRGLDFKERPAVVVINSSVVASTWGYEVPEEVFILGEVFRMTLLVDMSYNISRSYSGLIGMWMAASAGNSIYLVSDNIKFNDPVVFRVLAHELMHVLQYQHFIVPQTKSLDESLAIRSLIEGDADIVADRYVEMKGFNNVVKVSDVTFQDPFIDLQLMPYVFGGRFINRLLSEGGWESVNKAYSDPPRSMLHIMFPDKYLTNYEIRSISNNVSCNVVYEDVLGPSYLYLMVGKYFNKSHAFKLSELWVGDKVTYCRGVNNATLYWRIKFSSAYGAVEFYELYVMAAHVNGASFVDGGFLIDGLTVRVTQSLDEVMIESFEVKRDLPP